MKTSKVLAAGLLMLGTQAAMAANTIDMTWGGWGGADFGAGGVGYGSGSISPNPGAPGPFGSTLAASGAVTGVGVGGDNFTTGNTSYAFSSTGSFNTWCVDIYHWLSGGTINYTVGGTAELQTANPGAGTFGATRVADLQKLANEVYSGLHTQTDSAAFQLAVWAVMFSAPVSGVYQLESPTFYATNNSTGFNLAQSWLSNLNSAPVTGHYDLTYLYDSRPGSQNLVVFTTAVPEPETYAMMLAGLGLLGFLRRRKQAA